LLLESAVSHEMSIASKKLFKVLSPFMGDRIQIVLLWS